MIDYEKFIALRVEYFHWRSIMQKEVERVSEILFGKQKGELTAIIDFGGTLIDITWFNDEEEVKAERSFHPSLLFLSEEEIRANLATAVEMQKLIESTRKLGEQWMKLKTGYQDFSGS